MVRLVKCVSLNKYLFPAYLHRSHVRLVRNNWLSWWLSQSVRDNSDTVCKHIGDASLSLFNTPHWYVQVLRKVCFLVLFFIRQIREVCGFFFYFGVISVFKVRFITTTVSGYVMLFCIQICVLYNVTVTESCLLFSAD